MKTSHIIFITLSVVHFSLNASLEIDEECSNTDFDSSKPAYAETEEERVERLEGELMLALSQFDGCLEIMQRNQSIGSSSQSSQSNSAEGDEKGKEQEKSSENQPNTKYDEAKEADMDEVTGDNGAIPKDIPADSTDDIIAAQMKLVARAEKDPVKNKEAWDRYREYKGIKKLD
jgi:hypothetical protein